MSKGIYTFEVEFGRMGDLTGIFIADETDIQRVIGKEVYFGECLGKHSDIECLIKEDHFQLLSNDQDFITKFEEILGTGTISGYSPFDYIEDDEDESEDDD